MICTNFVRSFKFCLLFGGVRFSVFHCIYGFSFDYNAIDKSEVLNIQRHLMDKSNMSNFWWLKSLDLNRD